MSKIFYVEEDRNKNDFLNYGRVEHEGKIYILDGQAECTNRLLSSCIQDTHFEMSAPAHDEQRNKYYVFWIFETLYKDEEENEEGYIEPVEMDNYNYDLVDRVELA